MALSKPKLDLETCSDAENETMCGACKSDGYNRMAVKYCLDCNQSLCQTCVDCHRRIKQIKDHKLVDNTNQDAVKVAQFLSTCLTCPNHPDKNTDLMCKDHDVMCCITCATVGHRSCRQVVEVASQAATADMATKTQDLISHLDAAKDHMEEIVNLHQVHNDRVKAQLDFIIPSWLHELKMNVNRALTALESYVLECSNAKGNTEIEKGNTEIIGWKAFITTADRASKLLKAVQENGSDVHVYVAMNSIKKTLAEIDRNISVQGNQVNRQSIAYKECQYLQYLCLGDPRELVDVSVENTAFSLHQYKRVQPDMRPGKQYRQNHSRYSPSRCNP